MSEARLHSEQLAAIPNIRHEFANVLSGAPQGLWRPRQVHGREIVRPTGESLSLEADGSLTGPTETAVGVVTADCVPLLLVRSDGSAAAAIHAGWKGTALGIVEAAVTRVAEGADPAGLVAAMGPAASSGYEVGKEVLEGLRPRPERVLPTRPGHALLDLRGHVADRLVRAGVPAAKIEIVGPCTIASRAWPSYRREGDAAGRALAWVSIAPRA